MLPGLKKVDNPFEGEDLRVYRDDQQSDYGRLGWFERDGELHALITVGDGTGIHLDEASLDHPARVTRAPISELAGDASVRLDQDADTSRRLHPSLVVSLAFSHLLANLRDGHQSCIEFATWCATGQWSPPDFDRAGGRIASHGARERGIGTSPPLYQGDLWRGRGWRLRKHAGHLHYRAQVGAWNGDPPPLDDPAKKVLNQPGAWVREAPWLVRHAELRTRPDRVPVGLGSVVPYWKTYFRATVVKVDTTSGPWRDNPDTPIARAMSPVGGPDKTLDPVAEVWARFDEGRFRQYVRALDGGWYSVASPDPACIPVITTSPHVDVHWARKAPDNDPLHALRSLFDDEAQ